MEAAQRHRLVDLVWLAATLAVLALGFATVAWEWRKAHTAASISGLNTTGQNNAGAKRLKSYPQKNKND